MDNLPLLPRAFEDAFEAEKANAELAYLDRILAELIDDRRAAAKQQNLLRAVFFAYCAQARGACRQGIWTVAEARRASDAALPAIIDYYFEQYFRRDFERNLDRRLSDDEERDRRSLMPTMVKTSPQWKQHRLQLKSLAEGPSVASPVPSGGNGENPSASNAENGPRADVVATVANRRHGTDRRAAVDAYIAEVCVSTGKRISRADIWRKAGDKTRTEFERWESYFYERRGGKLNTSADRRFTRLLREKPHLK
jgi:hypothetical protein